MIYAPPPPPPPLQPVRALPDARDRPVGPGNGSTTGDNATSGRPVGTAPCSAWSPRPIAWRGLPALCYTEDGISPMAHPGMPGGMYLSESLEHDAYGHPDQTPDNHERMMQKRANKVETARRMLADWPMTSRRWGDRGAPFGIVGWGEHPWRCPRGHGAHPCSGHSCRGHLSAHTPAYARPGNGRPLATKRAILVPELNFSGQFGRMIEHRYYRQLGRVGRTHLPAEKGTGRSLSRCARSMTRPST